MVVFLLVAAGIAVRGPPDLRRDRLFGDSSVDHPDGRPERL
jgi:hypothetical protein